MHFCSFSDAGDTLQPHGRVYARTQIASRFHTPRVRLDRCRSVNCMHLETPCRHGPDHRLQLRRGNMLASHAALHDPTPRVRLNAHARCNGRPPFGHSARASERSLQAHGCALPPP
eukprot:3615123-Pleurochrysis_carterae.AAC.1